jgi:hypothetical protein
VTDHERRLASSFAVGSKWTEAFNSIEDGSETLVAGMAGWIRVTDYPEKSDRVYYMVTQRGLHVGQVSSSSGRLFRSSNHVDHFVPRETITAVDTDYQQAFQVDTKPGSRVIFWFEDVFSQFSEHVLNQRSAFGQASAVADALGWPLPAR